MTALRVQKLEIEDCEAAILRGYFESGRGSAAATTEPTWDDADEATRLSIALRGYDLYDGCPPQPGNEIRATEAFMSIGIDSGVTLDDVRIFLAGAPQARWTLSRIPDDARLEDATQRQLEGLHYLMIFFEAFKCIDGYRITKVLHEKRPAFIPVVDMVVVDFLEKNFPFGFGFHLEPEDPPQWLREIWTRYEPEIASGRKVPFGSRPRFGIWTVLNRFREILRLQAETLASIRRNIEAQGFSLTTLRILNSLIWLGWRDQVDESGHGPPLTQVWETDSVAGASSKAHRLWRDSGGVL